MAAVYFRRFARKGWTYVGSEVITGEVAFDLLWEQRGSLEADEIKTGNWAAGAYKTEAQAQAFGQARAGAELFGTRFRGVRLVLLKAPANAEFVTPEGIWS